MQGTDRNNGKDEKETGVSFLRLPPNERDCGTFSGGLARNLPRACRA